MSRMVSLITSAITVIALTACANGDGAGVPGGSYAASTRTTRRRPEATSPIKDGSFEKPAVPSASYELFTTGQTFSRWTVVGASGGVGIVSGTFTQNGFSFPAKSGKQWLDLTGNSNTATGISQTVATTPNAKYKLTFWVGNVYDPNGIFGVSSTVNVVVNGSQILSATNSRMSTTMVWRRIQHDDHGRVIQDDSRPDERRSIE